MLLEEGREGIATVAIRVHTLTASPSFLEVHVSQDALVSEVENTDGVAECSQWQPPCVLQ